MISPNYQVFLLDIGAILTVDKELKVYYLVHQFAVLPFQVCMQC